MRKTIILTLTATALIAGTLAEARPGARLRERFGSAETVGAIAQPPGKQTLRYGADPLQNLDFFPAANGNKRAPLVVFVQIGRAHV